MIYDTPRREQPPTGAASLPREGFVADRKAFFRVGIGDRINHRSRILNSYLCVCV